jgi:hypothetical protein
MPGYIKTTMLPLPVVMELEPQLPCSHCGELHPYAIEAIPDDIGPGEPHEHRVLVLYPFRNESILDWCEQQENVTDDGRVIPYHLWRWIPLVEADLPPDTLLHFFLPGVEPAHRDQPCDFVVVGAKVDQNLVFSERYVVTR